MDSFIKNIFEIIISEAGKLSMYTKNETLLSWDIQTAVRLVFSVKMEKHLLSKGSKTVTKFFQPKQWNEEVSKTILNGQIK